MAKRNAASQKPSESEPKKAIKKVMSKTSASTPAIESGVVAESAINKTILPKKSAIKSKSIAEISNNQIAERAYYIALTGFGGSEFDNWLRAERELYSESGD